MRFFWIGAAESAAVQYVLKKNALNASSLTYLALKEWFIEQYIDYFSSGWCKALENVGYEVELVFSNIELLQKKWCLENNIDGTKLSREEVLFLQIKKYRPDIVFVNDCSSVAFLKKIREEIHSIKLVLAWSGSALAVNPLLLDMWKEVDLIMCCAPEGVDYLNRNGANSVHINHAFFKSKIYEKDNVDILVEKVTFIGNIIRANDFHMQREKLLQQLGEKIPISMYTSSYYIGYSDIIKDLIKIGLYEIAHIMPEQIVDFIGKYSNTYRYICSLQSKPRFSVNLKLKSLYRKPVYGLDMLDVLHKSALVLNIHADSSPQYASNMRLFEATGVRSCLITDYRKNMSDLFEPDFEVVTYNSVDECIEKTRWLFNNPQKRYDIAYAGYLRCMKDHTYDNRAIQLDNIIRQKLR